MPHKCVDTSPHKVGSPPHITRSGSKGRNEMRGTMDATQEDHLLTPLVGAALLTPISPAF